MPTYRYELQQESGDLLIGQIAAQSAAGAASAIASRGGRIVRLVPLKIADTSKYIILDIIEPFTYDEIHTTHKDLIHSNHIIIPESYIETDIVINPLTMTPLVEGGPVVNQTGGGKKLPDWAPKKYLLDKMDETVKKRSDSKVIDYVFDVLQKHSYSLLCVINDTKLLVSKELQDSQTLHILMSKRRAFRLEIEFLKSIRRHLKVR